MEFMRNNYANRLELVRDFTFSLPPLKRNNGCTGRHRAWSTSMVPVSHMETTEGQRLFVS